MQYGSGQGDPTLREQICEVMALEGIDAHPDDVVVTVGSQQALDLVTRIFCRPRRRGPLRGARRTSARWASSAPTRRRRARRDGRRTGWCPEALARGDRRRAGGRASGPSSSTRSRTSTTRPASPCPPSAAREVLEICRRGRRAGRSRTTRTACSASTATRCRALRADDADGRGLPRLVLQDLRARASGSAGRWRRTPYARSSCWPRSRRRCARRRSPSSPCRPTSPSTTGGARSRRSARCTASAATRCSTRSTT